MIVRKVGQLRIQWIWKSRIDTAKGVRLSRLPFYLIQRHSSHFTVANAVRLKWLDESDLTVAENIW